MKKFLPLLVLAFWLGQGCAHQAVKPVSPLPPSCSDLNQPQAMQNACMNEPTPYPWIWERGEQVRPQG